MGLGPSTSSSQPELKLEPESLAILTSQRDLALKHRQDERREWYTHELGGRSSAEIEAATAQRSSRIFNALLVRLQEAAERGESSISYQGIFRNESVAWKYAQFRDGTLVSGPLDLSMVPFDHTVRIQATERVASALTASGLWCEVVRVPAACENCFLEELSLKVTIP
jgi:hypothetical protein